MTDNAIVFHLVITFFDFPDPSFAQLFHGFHQYLSQLIANFMQKVFR